MCNKTSRKHNRESIKLSFFVLPIILILSKSKLFQTTLISNIEKSEAIKVFRQDLAPLLSDRPPKARVEEPKTYKSVTVMCMTEVVPLCIFKSEDMSKRKNCTHQINF